MLDITKLGNSIEEIDFVILIVLAVAEITIDLLRRSRRSYQDTIANIAIAVVYIFASTAAIYSIAVAGLKFLALLISNVLRKYRNGLEFEIMK